MKVLSSRTIAFVVALLVPAVSWAASKNCLTGTAPEVTADPAQIAAVRVLIDSSCPCSNFDGSSGKTHGAYVTCANTIIKDQAAAGALRTQCKGTVKKYYSTSACGMNPATQNVPCVKVSSTTGKITCTITPTDKCVGNGKVTATACPTFTSCVDAADTNKDLMIGNGDSGTCATTCADGTAAFTSTFQAIQKLIFEKHSCNAAPCHGSSAQAGLDLSTDVAYKNLVGVPSTTNSEFNRVQIGDQNRSFLYLKLALSTDPSKIPHGVQ
ncbi:MAG: hypothetical protein ACRDL7_02980, partial [Gaiellaceae bacterium]